MAEAVFSKEITRGAGTQSGNVLWLRRRGVTACLRSKMVAGAHRPGERTSHLENTGKRTSAGRVKEDPGRTVFTSSEDLAALEPRVETAVFSRSFTEAGDTIAAQELDPGDLGAQSLRTTTETKCTATVENEKCELSR